MSTPDPTWLERAQRACDTLTAQLLTHPAVSMIDVGLETHNQQSTPVLRVYIRQRDATGLNVPSEVDGIPVHVISSDFHPE